MSNQFTHESFILSHCCLFKSTSLYCTVIYFNFVISFSNCIMHSLKLKFRKYQAMHTNRMLYHCTTLQYNFTIWHGRYAEAYNFKHEKWLIHQCCHFATFAASPSLLRCQATYVDGRKRENSSFWNIMSLLHPHADVSYSLVFYVTWVWVANCVCVMNKILRLYKFTIPCHCRRAWKTSRCARISRKLFLIGWICVLWGPCQPSVALRI